MGTRNEWKPWFVPKEWTPTSKKVECKFCALELVYRKDRMVAHLGYKKNDGKMRGVALCQRQGPIVKSLFSRCGGSWPPIPDDFVDEYVEDGGEDLVGSQQQASCGALSNANGSQTAPPSPAPSEARGLVSETTPEPHRRSQRQMGLKEGLQNSTKRDLDTKWSQAFYEANIPISIVRHPAFIQAVKATAEARIMYKPPSYHAMRKSLLDDARFNTQKIVELKTKSSIHKYGCTICSDGWENVVHRPLMNVMQICPAGDVFLGSIDTTGSTKDAAYVATEVKRYIVGVDPAKVVQVCFDNAAAMKTAASNISREWPHIYWQGCAAHCLNLLLKDWGKQRWAKDVVDKAKDIVKYIRAHQCPTAVFLTYSPNLGLKMPGSTRFATNFLMIDRLVKVRHALEQTVIHPDWTAYVNKLNRGGDDRRRSAMEARQIKTTVNDDNFWTSCDNYRHMSEEVLRALRVFDGVEPAMGKAWLTMKNLEKHVLSLRNPPFNLAHNLATLAEEDFYSRWRMMTTDLHHAGAILNPYLLDDNVVHEDAAVKSGFLDAMRRLTTGMDGHYGRVVAEFQAFKERRGAFANMPLAMEANIPPHEWWDLVGEGGTHLAPLAKRILAQVCSSSSCERNWSSYSFVHNKTRNRLSSARAENLVYIYTNSRLARERVDRDSAAWYLINMMSEDSDYSADEDINGDPPAGPGGDSSGHSDNESDGGHDGGNLGLDNHNDPFAFDGLDAEDDGDLHMWANIAGREFLSTTHVRPATPTTTIPDVTVDIQPVVHEDVVAEPHVDEAIEAAPNRMDMDEVPPHVSPIHPPADVVPTPMVPTTYEQPTQTTPPFSEPHGEGTSNVVLNHSPLRGLGQCPAIHQAPDSDSDDTLAQHIARRAPTIPRMGSRLVGATIGMRAPCPTPARPPPNIALTTFGRTTRGQKRKRQRDVREWRTAGPIPLARPQTDGIMDATGSRPMVSIRMPRAGTRLSRNPGPAIDGHESDARTDDNASTDDESGVGEAPDDSDYQAPPPRVAVGGPRRTRNSIPQDNDNAPS
jgi:hypothetical protein